MSSPSPPKPKKINPYAGVSSDADVYRAQEALGINKVKKDKHKREIDEWLLNERWDKESERSTFNNAYRSAMRQGTIGRKDRTQWALDQALAGEQTLIFDRQTDEQTAELNERYEKMTAEQKASADEQREFMKEMMDQPVYQAKQAMPISVEKPKVNNDPLLPAPATPMPMNIAPPPAPELTAASNRMAIVRTPKSTKTRQRRATRGTSSLIT
jgi:DNA-binding transcriptional regulator of glucitol operon